MANNTVAVNGSNDVENQLMKATMPTGDRLSLPLRDNGLTNGKIRHTESKSEFRNTQSRSLDGGTVWRCLLI